MVDKQMSDVKHTLKMGLWLKSYFMKNSEIKKEIRQSVCSLEETGNDLNGFIFFTK